MIPVQEKAQKPGVWNWSRSLTAVGWLTLAVLVVFPLFAWYGYSQSGEWGVRAALLAAGICWLGAALALLLAGLGGDPNQRVAGTLGGMFFRLGLPLVAVTYLQSSNGPLQEAGVVGMVLAYYAVTLVVETMLSVNMLSKK